MGRYVCPLNTPLLAFPRYFYLFLFFFLRVSLSPPYLSLFYTEDPCPGSGRYLLSLYSHPLSHPQRELNNPPLPHALLALIVPLLYIS